MATTARFLKAADNTRPYKSHRYDVFGLKVERNLALFGRAPLNAWVMLESDPAVLSYCERPLVIPDLKPKRVIDFWVSYRDREEFWLLQRPSELSDDSPDKTMPAFVTWATSRKIAVRQIIPDDIEQRATFLDNWGRIIRELSANLRYVPKSMIERVHGSMATSRPLSALSGQFPDDDPVLLRTAAFSLLHAGTLRCRDIEELPIGPGSMVEPS
jgi:hypothetical protein